MSKKGRKLYTIEKRQHILEALWGEEVKEVEQLF